MNSKKSITTYKLNSLVNFGKYKTLDGGKWTIQDVLDEGDPHYITWALNKISWFRLSKEAFEYYRLTVGAPKVSVQTEMFNPDCPRCGDPLKNYHGKLKCVTCGMSLISMKAATEEPPVIPYNTKPPKGGTLFTEL